MKRFTVERVEKLREELLNDWRQAHTAWLKWEALAQKRHTIRYASPAEPRKLSTGVSKITQMVDTLVTREPHVFRRPLDVGEKAQARADKLERWAEGFFRHLASDTLLVPPFRTASEFLALLGYTVGAVRWDSRVWPVKPHRNRRDYDALMERYEKAREGAFPFMVEFPHPARVLLPPMERQPSLAIETYTMKAYQVEAMLTGMGEGGAASELHADDSDSLMVVTSHSADWFHMMVQGEEAVSRANGLGFVPYLHGYAGLGREQSPVWTNPVTANPAVAGDFGPQPHDLAIGLLAYVTDSIIALDEWFTAMHTLTMRAAYRHVVTTEDTEELARQFEEADIAGIIQVGPEGQLKWEDSPNVQPWMFQVAAAARADIDQGTFAGEVAGQRSPGVETATQHALMLGTAKLRFGLPIQQLNFLAQQGIEMAARIMEARGEAVTIDGVKCGAADFDGVWRFSVDFTAADEGERLRQKEQGMREIQAGLLDFNTYQQAVAGRQDATGLRRRVLVDKALPEILPTIIEAVDTAFRQRHEMEPKPTAAPQTSQEAQSFAPQPGGAVQAQQLYQGMTNTPAAGLGRLRGQ